VRVAVADPDEAARHAPPAASTEDRRRLAGLLQQHFRLVWRTLRRLGLTAAAADDAAQQVFLVVVDRLDQIEPAKERAFLIGTAYRVAANARRKEERRPDLLGELELERQPDSAQNPEQLVERKRWRELLDVVLDGMPLDLRTVFVLFELEDLSSPEIAAALGVPLGTVASRLRRAREEFASRAARLKQHLARGDQ
jgi:RNA polymerase sigma-70 factor (ECF subfamily)